MKTHSSILAWEIPWTEEPGGLQSMGSQRVGHNYNYSHKLGEEFMNPKQNIFLCIHKNEKKNAKLQEITYKFYLPLYVTLSPDWIHSSHVSFLKKIIR